MKKLCVNQDACISCGACVSIDSTHFDWNDEGKSHAISQENLDSENVQTAVESCPTGAISIEEENYECDNCDCDNCEHEQATNEGSEE